MRSRGRCNTEENWTLLSYNPGQEGRLGFTSEFRLWLTEERIILGFAAIGHILTSFS